MSELCDYIRPAACYRVMSLLSLIILNTLAFAGLWSTTHETYMGCAPGLYVDVEISVRRRWVSLRRYLQRLLA